MFELFNDKEFLKAIHEIFVASGDEDCDIAFAAQKKLAKALQEPLRQGILVGDILSGIFQTEVLGPGATPKYLLDVIAPGEEGAHVAYTIPKTGYIPHRVIEGDYVTLPTYRTGSSIDWPLFLARDSRYMLLARAMEVLYAGFTKKLNDDGFHTLLAAAADRNIVVYDADASIGQLTKRLFSLLNIAMIRNGGGNSASIVRRKLTDLKTSPEAVEDIRNWGIDQVDEVTRREFYVNDSKLTRIFGVNIEAIDEFGEDNEYQRFYTNQIGGTMGSSDVEIVLGLDLSRNDSFVMPVREELSIFPDPTLHRQQMAGVYGWMEGGFGVLDGRATILGSI
jgi:hypothetical protein